MCPLGIKMGRADYNQSFLNLPGILGSNPELLYQDLHWPQNSIFSKEKLGPCGLPLANDCFFFMISLWACGPLQHWENLGSLHRNRGMWAVQKETQTPLVPLLWGLITACGSFRVKNKNVSNPYFVRNRIGYWRSRGDYNFVLSITALNVHLISPENPCLKERTR